MPKENEAMPQLEVSQLLSSLVDALRGSQLTPEIIEELRKPWEDPIAMKQRLDTRKALREQQAEVLESKRLTQEYCPHMRGGKDKVQLVHNFADGRTRGICLLCQKVFQPEHYEWDHITKSYQVVPADPDYARVVEAERAVMDGV